MTHVERMKRFVAGKLVVANLTSPSWVTLLTVIAVLSTSLPAWAKAPPWQAPPPPRTEKKAEAKASATTAKRAAKPSPAKKETPAVKTVAKRTPKADVKPREKDDEVRQAAWVDQIMYEDGGDPSGGYWNDPVSDYGYPYLPALPRLRGRIWTRADYLFWWTQGTALPPLVTTSSQNDAGVLGRATTNTLFGHETINNDARSGGRITLGYWLQPCNKTGIEFTYLTLGDKESTFQASQDDYAVLARPFYDTALQAQNAELVAFPNVLDGTITVEGRTKYHTMEFLLRRKIGTQCNRTLDFLIGYRTDYLKDDLLIREDLDVIGAGTGMAIGTNVDLYDRFDTTNRFHGVEFGFAGQARYNRFTMNVLMKLALGNTHTRVFIDGQTTRTVDAVATPGTGGILALPSNMGTFSSNDFTVIPELGVTLGYDVTCRLRATLGYSFIYWSKVSRVGEQIDFDLNPGQFPFANNAGGPRPEFSEQTTDFWAQGLNFGLEYHY